MGWVIRWLFYLFLLGHVVENVFCWWGWWVRCWRGVLVLRYVVLAHLLWVCPFLFEGPSRCTIWIIVRWRSWWRIVRRCFHWSFKIRTYPKCWSIGLLSELHSFEDEFKEELVKAFIANLFIDFAAFLSIGN